MSNFNVLLVLMVVIVNLSYVLSGADTFMPSSSSPPASEFSSSAISSLPSSSKIPDPCPNAFDLKDSGGNVLRHLCFIIDSQSWYQSRQRCLDIGYTLFRIDNVNVATAFAERLASVGAGPGTVYWLNGIGNADGKWRLVDPDGLFPFLATPATAGMCYQYYYLGNLKYEARQMPCTNNMRTMCQRP